ncbi:hypothetical protein AZH53_08870 [Methanomicrobiaceae archaeon CYW5]|uniref:hypothetical protein n=1 Tax=Methanovulcanius yangii TaxID=1789227 RepID=UPI0029CA8BCF|nr:hypothetical protein [Methanovulcanius yangii]MBT8508517.1 hypothetical protein [Methanovulcanius yangii]
MSPGHLYSIEVENISVHRFTLTEIACDVKLYITNRTPVRVTITRIPFTLTFTEEGSGTVHCLGTGEAHPVKIAPGGVAGISVPVAIRNHAAISLVTATLGNRQPVTVSGHAYVDAKITELEIPFSQTVVIPPLLRK